jgi:aromatic ring-opening dioxygenase LigB subunit
LNLKPEIIFLSSPHGIQVDDHFAFYTNSKAIGFIDLKSTRKNVEIKLDLDKT